MRDLPPELKAMLTPYDPRVRELFAAARAAIVTQAPDAVELAYDSYNAVAAAYAFTGRLRDAFCHVAAYTHHVNLGFNRGAELDDPDGLLSGSGRSIRHIRIDSRETVSRPEIVALIRQAVANAPRGDGGAELPRVVARRSARKKRPR